MNYKELKHHASTCQMSADEMAIRLIKVDVIKVVQSMCNFNLFYVYDISPEVFVHFNTIEFLYDNIKHFKRKISIKELSNYDHLITHNKINSFDEFKNKLI